MKRKVLSVLLACSMVLSLAACGSGNSGTQEQPADSAPAQEAASTQQQEAPADEAEAADPTGGEVVDGKFTETRKITVEVYDRGNDGGSDPTNNMYTQYIKDGMLADHNVEVEFISVPRWTEVEQINNLLAAGDAPDICVTYDYATIQTYANMGGVLDLSSYVADYAELLPNLWDWLGETNIYWDKDPATGTLWAIEAKLAVNNRNSTFVRKDWLDKLGLAEPTTRQEFEDMLYAFKENAETLLGADADKIIPFSISFDVGWRASNIIDSFIDPNISDKDRYVYGFDDRKLTLGDSKEVGRLLNKWYNEGLMWDDFALYGSGDTTEDDMMKAGYVGAFIHNWDYPYRNGEDSIQSNLERLVGEDAKYVAVECFESSDGSYTKLLSGPVDRKVFFPATNEEPLASLMYLDWISQPEHLEYLQIGDEGVTHNKLEDGAVEIVAATGDAIQNSGFNIDYTITCNGMNLTDYDVTVKSLAHSYAGIDPELVEKANTICNSGNLLIGRNVNVGAITAEEGMGTVLSEKRNILWDTAVTASVENFDQVWDNAMADYLSSGGQAIIDERAEKWTAMFGDAEQLPD